MFVTKSHKKKIVMLMLFICINLPSVLDMFLCLLTIAIYFVLLLLHNGFVLSVLNIIHVLDLESVCFQTFIQRITLDMFHSLFIVIVDSCNVIKISYHAIPYHYINQLYPTHRTFDTFLNHKRWSKSTLVLKIISFVAPEKWHLGLCDSL